MKPVTAFQIHKIIAQTAVYLVIVLAVITFLKKYHLVDQHREERMNEFFISYLRGGLIYAITLFYLISLYAFILLSISSLKDVSTRKASLIYIILYMGGLFFSVCLYM